MAKAKQKSGDGLQANNNSFKTVKSVFVTVTIIQQLSVTAAATFRTSYAPGCA